MNTKMIVMSRSPNLAGKARQYGFGYRKFALVEIDPSKLPEGETEPKLISDRSIGVVKVHRVASVYYGEGVRSEGKYFLEEITKEAEEFNAKAQSEADNDSHHYPEWDEIYWSCN